MADPRVEKLKELGLRYGDKAAVVLTSLLFVFCLGVALKKKSIELTPDQVKKSAEAADTNIRRHQEPDAIIRVLEAAASSRPTFPGRLRSGEEHPGRRQLQAPAGVDHSGARRRPAA